MSLGDDGILLRLVVDRDADPITGTLTQPGEEPVLFTGWLGLTNAIEAVRTASGQPPKPDPEHRSPSTRGQTS